MVKCLGAVAAMIFFVTGCAGVAPPRTPFDGIWAVDIEATSKSHLATDSSGKPKICGKLGISFLPIMFIVEVDGPIAWVGGLGAPVETKILFQLTEEKEKVRVYRGVLAKHRDDYLTLSLDADGYMQVEWERSKEPNGYLWSRRDVAWVSREAAKRDAAVKERFEVVSKMCKYGTK